MSKKTIPSETGLTTLAGLRLAVVTGAARGIGAAVVKRYLVAGYAVLGLDLTEAAVPMENCHASRYRSLICDISDRSEVEAVGTHLRDAGLNIDVVANVAGISPHGTILQTSDEEWDHIFAVNVGGIRHTVLAFDELLSDSAAIVNVSSGAGLRAIPGLAGYVASKHAVIGLTRAMALDYSARGIRVNCVCPGQVDTDLARSVQDQRTGEAQERAMAFSDYMIRRIATPAEIAESVFFLGSDSATYITGSALAVDAGRTQH